MMINYFTIIQAGSATLAVPHPPDHVVGDVVQVQLEPVVHRGGQAGNNHAEPGGKKMGKKWKKLEKKLEKIYLS